MRSLESHKSPAIKPGPVPPLWRVTRPRRGSRAPIWARRALGGPSPALVRARRSSGGRVDRPALGSELSGERVTRPGWTQKALFLAGQRPCFGLRALRGTGHPLKLQAFFDRRGRLTPPWPRLGGLKGGAHPPRSGLGGRWGAGQPPSHRVSALQSCARRSYRGRQRRARPPTASRSFQPEASSRSRTLR